MKHIDKISNLIIECEKHSNAEIVCVLSKNFSARVLNKFSVKILIFLVFLISFLCIYFFDISSIALLEFQMIAFFVVEFLGYILRILPKGMKLRLSYLIAFMHFRDYEFNKSKNSIMLFVFSDIKCAHIIIGKNILDDFTEEPFKNVIRNFMLNVKKMSLDDTILNSIEEITKIVQNYRNSDINEDEIPKEVIIIE